MPSASVRTRRPSIENTSASTRPGLASESVTTAWSRNGFGTASDTSVCVGMAGATLVETPSSSDRLRASRARTERTPIAGSPTEITSKATRPSSHSPTKPAARSPRSTTSAAPGPGDNSTPSSAASAGALSTGSGRTTAGSHVNAIDAARTLPVPLSRSVATSSCAGSSCPDSSSVSRSVAAGVADRWAADAGEDTTLKFKPNITRSSKSIAWSVIGRPAVE
jgi:hypothetical protein